MPARQAAVWAQFGAEEVWYSATSCSISSFTRSSRIGVVRCLTTPATGANFTWKLSIGGQSVRMNDSFTMSFAPPSLISIESSDADTQALDSRGGTLAIDFIGQGFGPVPGRSVSAVALMSLQGTSTDWPTVVLDRPFYYMHLGGVAVPTWLFPAVNCSVVEDDVRIRCIVPQGAGSDLTWILSVDGQTSAPVTQMGHNPPEITQVRYALDPAATVEFASPDGGDVIALIGRNFGPGANRNIACRGNIPTYVPGVTPQLRRCWGYVQSIRLASQVLSTKFLRSSHLPMTPIYLSPCPPESAPICPSQFE